MSQSVQALQSRIRVPRVAEAAVRRARLSVVPRRIAEAPRVPFVALITFVMIAGVVSLLMFNTSMQQSSFAATSLKEQADTLTAREAGLRTELEGLRDPQRIAEEAVSLGMVPALAPAFLHLKDGSISGEPRVAVREDGVRLQARPPRKPAVLNPKPIVVEEVADTGASTPAAGASAGETGTQ